MKKIFIYTGMLCMIAIFAWSESLIPPDLVIENSFVPGLGESVGEVKEIQGEVIAIHSEDLQRGFSVKSGTPLFQDDTVITKEKARVNILFNDESELTLASSTKLVISRSVYDPEKKSRLSFMQMTSGKARFLIRGLGDYRQSRFNVKTNTALIGVRGSDFIIETREESTRVTTLQKTQVEITSLSKPDETLMLKSFEQCVVDAGALPSPPEKITQEQIDILLNDFIIMDRAEHIEQIEITKKVLVSKKELVTPEDSGKLEGISKSNYSIEREAMYRHLKDILEQKDTAIEERREYELSEAPPFPVKPN